ncbi:MAG: hypothetical protein RR620_05925 [Clostridium sp.]
MNFLYGTYGFDWLSIFLLFVSMLLNFSHYTNILGLFCTGLAIFRAFSKDIPRRTAEMNKFILIVNKLLGKFGKRLPSVLPRVSLESLPMLFQHFKNYLAQKKQFKIVKCPQCNQKLRLPRGKGTIVVTCKKCSNKFNLKT